MHKSTYLPLLEIAKTKAFRTIVTLLFLKRRLFSWLHLFFKVTGIKLFWCSLSSLSHACLVIDPHICCVNQISSRFCCCCSRKGNEIQNVEGRIKIIFVCFWEDNLFDAFIISILISHLKCPLKLYIIMCTDWAKTYCCCLQNNLNNRKSLIKA